MIFISWILGEHNEAIDDKILNNTDANRYFTVETAQGYIAINREYEKIVFIYDRSIEVLFSFKDQTEGGRLLSYIAQMNSWPAAIFTKLK